MRADNTNLFHRLAKDVRIRDVQRRFAFTWDLDQDGFREAESARHYLKEVGVVSRSPVLLTANYDVPTAGVDRREGFRLGVWFPDRVFPRTCCDGKFDEDLLSELNEWGGLDGGCALGTIELLPDEIIAADTPLIDLFDSSPDHGLPRFVCDGFTCTGVVSDRDLLAPPGRICLLAMALELEEQATTLCRTFSSRCFAQLPSGRQQKAMKVFMDRFGLANGKPTELKKLSEKMRTREMLSDREEIEGPLASIAPANPPTDRMHNIYR